MKTKQHKLEEIEICKEIIRANTERVEAIAHIAQNIADSAKYMRVDELQKAIDELADMRKEMAELNRAIRSAKLAIKEFYAPAMVI